MSASIDESVSSNIGANDEQLTHSSIQRIDGRQRLVAFALRAVPALSIAGWLLFLRRPEDSQDSTLFWSVSIIVCGLLMGFKASNIREVRIYELTEVHFTKAQRLRRAAMWVIPSFGMLILTWLLQIRNDQFNQYWWYPWPLLFPLLVGLGLYLLRSDKVLSSAGQVARNQDEATSLHLAKMEAQKIAQMSASFDSFMQSTPVRYAITTIRYAIAIVFLYGAYVSAFQSNEKNALSGALFCVFASFFFAQEVGVWLVGLTVVAGMFWGFFTGIAALPTSAAIIIGAVIIALALQR